jgi:nucleotide-binding universal stress UspA family protein
MPKRKILVPVDGTEFSYRIFPTLAKLLNADDNEIILLTVGDIVRGHMGSPPRPIAADSSLQGYETAKDFEYASHPIYASQERDSAVANFRSATQARAEVLEQAGFAVVYDMRFGEPVEEIIAYVDANNVDLIAMATHWRTGLDRLFNGNTLTGILPRVDVPLLVIRSDEE